MEQWELILLAAAGGVFAAIVIGLAKLTWFLTKCRWEKAKVINTKRKRFRTDFNRLVESAQRLRGDVYPASGIPRNIVDRFANELTRTSPHIKPSVRKIAQDTIAQANKYFEQGPVGDEFVDYLERQRKKAIKKNRTWGL
jgi:hypothetical protein